MRSARYSLHLLQSSIVVRLFISGGADRDRLRFSESLVVILSSLYLPRSQLRRGFSSLTGAVDGIRKGSFEVVSLSLSCTQDDGSLSTVSSLARCAFNSNVPTCRSNGFVSFIGKVLGV